MKVMRAVNKLGRRNRMLIKGFSKDTYKHAFGRSRNLNKKKKLDYYNYILKDMYTWKTGKPPQ